MPGESHGQRSLVPTVHMVMQSWIKLSDYCVGPGKSNHPFELGGPSRDSTGFGAIEDPDAGRDWGQEEKGTTEDEMAG